MHRCTRYAVLSLLLLTLSVTPAPRVAADGWTVLAHHTIQPGDTLFCIARGYGVDPWAIASQNRILKSNLIYPGVVLAIPNVPATLPPGPTCPPQSGGPACRQCACRETYVIEMGDTLYAVSRKFDANVRDLAACNCLADPNYIRVADTLCIP